MPLPFILAGAAVVAGIAGAAKGAIAIFDSMDADDKNKRANEIFNDAKQAMESEKTKTVEQLEKLGRLKLEVWDNQLGRFVRVFKQIKNVELINKKEIEGELKNL